MMSAKSPQEDRHADILRRLRCAAGHLNAVIEMAEGGQSCEKILHQLNAVQSALRIAGLNLIHCQAIQSEALILDGPASEQRAAELKRLQSLYALLIQKPEPYHEVSK